jgi:hypothetical protein
LNLRVSDGSITSGISRLEVISSDGGSVLMCGGCSFSGQ